MYSSHHCQRLLLQRSYRHHGLTCVERLPGRFLARAQEVEPNQRDADNLCHRASELVQPHLSDGSILGWTCSLEVFGNDNHLYECEESRVLPLQLGGEAGFMQVLFAMRH